MHPWVLEVSPVEETTCKEVRGQLADYRKHRVKHPEKGRIERHLYYCPECIFQLALVTARSLDQERTRLVAGSHADTFPQN